jgi:hypothetical protein
VTSFRAWPLAWLLVVVPATAAGETLRVGPGRPFAVPSRAIAAARDGDVIEIDAAGRYDGDVAVIRAKGLTLRGLGPGRPRLDAQGKSAAGKGIWVQYGDDLTVENVEFVGARCPDRDGAGIRAQAPGLTVRGCRFYDCENGILGGAGEVLVEHSEFDHCGLNGSPATHSAYVSAACTKLVFRFNYSTHTLEGHLLKSRARESWVVCNRLTDEDGSGSAVADFPNGGLVVMTGNVLHKGAGGHNDRVIAYGMEGIKHARNGLYVVHNTMLYEHRHRTSWFVRVEGAPEDFRPVLRNNVCVGPVPLTNSPRPAAAGNLLLESAAKAGFADPARYDFRLTAASPCIDRGVDPGAAGDARLAPEFQYVHPCKDERRPDDGKPDVGAYEYAAPGERK